MSDCKYRAVAWVHMRYSIMICGGRGNDHFILFFIFSTFLFVGEEGAEKWIERESVLLCLLEKRKSPTGNTLAAKVFFFLRNVSAAKRCSYYYCYSIPIQLDRWIYVFAIWLYHQCGRGHWHCHWCHCRRRRQCLIALSECCVFAKIIIVAGCSFDECNLHCVYERS